MNKLGTKPIDISGSFVIIEQNDQARIVLQMAIEHFVKIPKIIFNRNMSAGIETIKSLAQSKGICMVISDIQYSGSFNIHSLIRKMEDTPLLWNVPLILYTNEIDAAMINKIRKNIKHLPFRIMIKSRDHILIAKTCQELLGFQEENRHYLEIENSIATYARIGNPELILNMFTKIDSSATKYKKAFPAAKVNFLKGKTYYELWKMKQVASEKLVKEIEKYSQDSPEALAKVAELELLTKELENDISKAEEYFGAAKETSPNFWPNLYMLFNISMVKNKMVKAKEYLIELIDIFPDQSEYYYEMGKISELEGDLIGALENYFSAGRSQMEHGYAGRSSENVMEIVDKSLSLTEKLMKKHSITKLSSAEHIHSFNDSLPMETLQKMNALSRMAMKEVIKDSPKDATLYNKIAITHRRTGDSLTAIQMYKKALEIDPEDYRIRINYAAAIALRGSWDQAIEEMKKVIDLDSKVEDEEISNSLMDILEKKDKVRLEKILV